MDEVRETILPPFFMGEVPERSVGDGGQCFRLAQDENVSPHRAPRDAHFPRKRRKESLI